MTRRSGGHRLPSQVAATPARPLGMTTATFLRDYWQQRPLLIRGAFADFVNPVAPDDLAGLACEDLALARIAVHEPKRDRWTLRTGPFAETDFATLPKTHWTLLVQDVDKWDADVAALLGTFAFLPSWRIDDVMVSYAEEGGSVGAHVDNYDVFLLQGIGRRHWQISTDADAPRAFRDDAELKLLRTFTPTDEWTLEPGDMLYLPPGVPHHGVAVDGACMTYSIGMRAPSQAELVGDFVDHVIESLPEDLRYTDPGIAAAKFPGEIDAATLERVAAAMPWLRVADKVGKATRARGDHAGIDAAVLRTWFGQFITRYRSSQTAAPPPRPISDATLARALANGSDVQRNPWSRSAWMREGRGATLFVAGQTHACSTRLAIALCSSPRFALADALGSTGAASGDRAVIRALIDAGHLALVRARRSP